MHASDNDDDDDSLQGGKSDSESPPSSDNEAAPPKEEQRTNRRADALDEAISEATSASVQQQAQKQDASHAPDALFAGVTIIRADELSVGAYLASGAFGQVFRGQWKGEAVALKAIDFDHAKRKLP